MEDLAEVVALSAEDLIRSAKAIVKASNSPAVQQQVIKSTSQFSVATSQLVAASNVNIYINILFTYIVLGNCYWETYLYELVMAVYQISFLVYTPGKEMLPQFTFDSQLP